MMQFFSVVSSLFLLAYLLGVKRRIDPFLVAGISLLLFFIPILFGVIPGFLGYPSREVMPTLYLTFISGNILLVFFAFVYDNTLSKKCRVYSPFNVAPLVKISTIFFSLWFLLLIVNLNKYGTYLFTGMSKRELMDSSGASYFVFIQLSTITSLSLILTQKINRIIVGVVILFIVLIIGYRSPVALVGIASFLVWGSHLGKVSLVRRYHLKLVVFIVLPIFALAVLKPIYSNFKGGGISQVMSSFSNTSLTDMFLSGAEFLRTQYIFNEIVRFDFVTSGGSVLRAPLSLLPVPRSLYTTPSSEFNDLFQPVLFPDVSYGMAYNPFAEVYSFSGFWGIAVLLLFYCSVIFILSFFLLSCRYSFLPVVSLCTALVAFYFYRNSLAVTFGYMRNFVYPYLLILLIVAIPSSVSSHRLKLK